jgi:putative ABC transport system permease protein
MIPLRYNVRSLAVRKTTTLATGLGIALVVWVLASALMLSAGIRKTLGTSGRADTAIVLRQGSDAELGSAIEDSSVNIILAAPGVAKEGGSSLGVGETVVVAAIAKLGAEGVSNVQMRGVSDDVMKFRPEVKIIAGRNAQPGSDEVIIGSKLRGRFKGLDIGQSFDIKKNRPVTVVGVFDSGGSSYESEIWVERDILRAAYGRQGVMSSVRVRLESASAFDAFQIGVEQDKRLGLMTMRESTYYEKQSEGTSKFMGAMGVLIAVFFSIGAMIGAMITMYAAVANRKREIGTLRALGFSRGSILGCFLLEAVILAFAGGAVGALASLGMGYIHLSMMNMASWSEISFSFEPTGKILTIALSAAGIMGLVGGFFPAIQASRVSPVAAMRG